MKGIFIPILIGLFICTILFFFLIKERHMEERNCINKGGHIISIYRDNLCVSKDGRIIE